VDGDRIIPHDIEIRWWFRLRETEPSDLDAGEEEEKPAPGGRFLCGERLPVSSHGDRNERHR
jgi:hypothetical protein